MTDPMITLQNRWYNGLIESLPGLNALSFQISQPCLPVVCTKSLWDNMNVIPPASLTFNRSLLADRVFDNYVAVVGQLKKPEDYLAEAIGEQNLRDWSAYLAKQDPPPPSSKLPETFRNWAMVSAPTVINQGASALIRMNIQLETYNGIRAYQGLNARTADFNLEFKDLLQMIRNSPSATLSVSTENSTNVEGAWAVSDHSEVQGLWHQDRRGNRLSRHFATSEVSINASFQHFLVAVVPPGDWYQSALLHTAYSNPGSPTWRQNAAPNWDEAFGENGFLRRFLASLVVVDGVSATITSGTSYTESDQLTILAYMSKGLWPFYSPTGARIDNSVTFGASGMTIKFSSEVGNPLIIGGNVLGVDRYLGH